MIMLRHITVKEAAEKENYKIRPDMAEWFTGVSSVQEMAFKLAHGEKYKEACELLAYAAHRRAGVWWLYRCVDNLEEELRENPASDRDISDIAASFAVTVPDWAKVKAPESDPAGQAQIEDLYSQSKAQVQKAEAALDPEMLRYVRDAVEVAFQDFKKVHGIHPVDLLKNAAARINEDPHEINPDSPVFKAADELKAKLQGVQKETVAMIKAVIPPKVPEHEKKLRDNALHAVYRWVVAPDEINSQKCLDLGNECPDTPPGLLALSSFWASGNLMPGGKQIVHTPPGLAANGLNQTLLMCALHKGGTRKLKARYERYFNLGVDVLSGKDNWGESLAEGQPPHQGLSDSGAVHSPGAPHPEAPKYKRWKPENI